MSDQPGCNHAVIQRTKGPYEDHWQDQWVCEGCGDSFAPVAAFASEIAAVEQQSDDVIDMATSMFSAMLWDLHSRAYESKQVSDPPRNYAADVCAERGHDRGDDGVCIRCNHSPFLGDQGGST